MANDYAPKQFLRQAENALLKEYFAARDELGDIDWANLKETDVDPVYAAWQALPEHKQEEIERDFRDIFDLGSSNGTRTLIEEGRFHNIDLTAELEAREGFINKAFWVFLKHRRVFEVAHLLDWADHLNGRYWRKRKNLPKKKPDLSDNAIKQLEDAIKAYYREQGRGKRCHVDKYLRGDRSHYFFAYPQDYTDTFVGFDDDGRFDRRPQNPAFEVLYVYDPVDGTLDLYAQGGKEIKNDLQQIFGRTILHEEIGEENAASAPYRLEGLKNRLFAFPTDPADRVTEVRVKELRLSIIGNPRQRITFEATPKGPQAEVYDLMQQALDERRMPMAMVNVTSAVIQMRFDNTNGGNGRATKTITFRVAAPDSCNLKDKPEHMVAKKYLKLWEIENA